MRGRGAALLTAGIVIEGEKKKGKKIKKYVCIRTLYAYINRYSLVGNFVSKPQLWTSTIGAYCLYGVYPSDD